MRTSRFMVLASAATAVACADGPVGPSLRAPDTVPPAAESDPLTPVRTVSLSLVGRGTTFEYRTRTPSGEQRTLSTVIEAASREIVVGEPVDTLLAIAFPGVPATGNLVMTPPTAVTIRDVSPGIPIIFFEGSPGRLELVVFTRFSGFPARQFVQAMPATLRITEYVAPGPLGDDGRVVGEIDFLADEYYREWAPDGAITVRQRTGNVRVKAQFQVRLHHEVRIVEPPVHP